MSINQCEVFSTVLLVLPSSIHNVSGKTYMVYPKLRGASKHSYVARLRIDCEESD